MFIVLLLLFVLSTSIFSSECQNNFDVMDYGAISDGNTDDSQAFLKAWNDACNASTQYPRVVVPANRTFLVNPIMFHGPCNAHNINVTISGTIIAPNSTKLWDKRDASEWLGFKDVSGLNVDGFGVIDGRGKTWWDQSCRYHPHLEQCTTLAPTALQFLSCTKSSISNMVFKDSAQTHILVKECNNFTMNNIFIDSPGNSPNTDGIHIQASNHVVASNANIGCGDDCISIGDHISDIQIANVKCGPGHGISIGSLGKGGSYVQVENIHVTNAFFNGTTNGARIKTWQVGKGYVRDVTFQNLTVHNVKNPIIIDQNYCDVRGGCKEMKTAVEISNVTYKDISGTSNTYVAINLNCSKSVPCSGISMESIQLISVKPFNQVVAECFSSYGQETDVVPGPCLLPKN